MNQSLRRSRGPSAFTMVEMLVSIAVLAILLVALAQMLNLAGTSIKDTSGHMDADGEARAIFDRLAADFTAMPKRDDLDYHFVSQTGNDKFFFYAESSTVLPSTAPSTLQNSVSLVGYQINGSNQLERLGYGLNWDQSGDSAPYLTFPNAATSFLPDPMSTIDDGGAGAWSSVIANDGSSGGYHVLGDMVFRMEFCFLLKDGTYSVNPIVATSPTGWPTAATFYTSQPGAPTPTSDSSQGYAASSRWWDSSHDRGYICLRATAGSALWRPVGWDDVAGVVIALGLLDTGSRKILSAANITLSTVISQLADVTTANLSSSPPQLMGAVWQAKVLSSSFAGGSGLPKAVAAQVRIYQRCIYLNNDLR